MAQQRSIEEQVEDWCKQQLHGNYFTKTQPINPEIDDALRKAPSKNGGTGNNYPDIKYLIQTPDMRNIPVMIEVKGTKGALIKTNELHQVDNTKKDGTPNYADIAKYAVNGAVHYADAILHYTSSYNQVIAVGVNGFQLNDKIQYELKVFYISKDNLFVPKEVASFSDLSFLQENYLPHFIQQIDQLSLSNDELEHQKLQLEDDIERKLKALNQKMHDQMKIAVGQRVQLVAGLIMAGLGVPNKVAPLNVNELKGELNDEDNDGQVIMRKIKNYLTFKYLPAEKIQMIVGVLNVVFLHAKLNEPHNGESDLHTLYADIRRDIIPFVSGELHNIDFTGRLFNVLNEWVDVPDGDKNDVVLTPRYVTELMAKLCRVNQDSFVWDFATGSAGFLISAMHLMIDDAKAHANSDAQLQTKINQIKMEQLLGIEKLPDVYMLAVLNMILMKDGSANIIHGDSLTQFNGNYEQGAHKGQQFPANVFLLNPPYSAPGKGFVFVDRALSMMNHGGYAAVLIQENAGSGNGLPYTENILRNNTLIASIKMSDIFCGKASVQTAIYVFKVGEPHNTKSVVRFIDFSNDGYSRQNRKKSSQSVNLRDTDNAKQRYQEIVNLVCFGRGTHDENLHYYKDCFVEDTITLSGKDWTYGQHRQIDTTPTYDDFANTVKDYLAWKVAQIIKQQNEDGNATGDADAPVRGKDNTKNDTEDCLGKH